MRGKSIDVVVFIIPFVRHTKSNDNLIDEPDDPPLIDRKTYRNNDIEISCCSITRPSKKNKHARTQTALKDWSSFKHLKVLTSETDATLTVSGSYFQKDLHHSSPLLAQKKNQNQCQTFTIQDLRRYEDTHRAKAFLCIFHSI